MSPALLEAITVALSAILKTIEDAKSGNITEAEALARIAPFDSQLASDDADVEAAAAAKFGTKP